MSEDDYFPLLGIGSITTFEKPTRKRRKKIPFGFVPPEVTPAKHHPANDRPRKPRGHTGVDKPGAGR